MLTYRFWLRVLFSLVLVSMQAVAQGAEEHPVVTLVKSKVKDPAKPFALFVTIKAKRGRKRIWKRLSRLAWPRRRRKRAAWPTS
jgi:hypothetical protein